MRRLFNLFVLFFVVSVMTINFVSCDADSSGGGGGGTANLDAEVFEKEIIADFSSEDIEEGITIHITTEKFKDKLKATAFSYVKLNGNEVEDLSYTFKYKESKKRYNLNIPKSSLPIKNGTYEYTLGLSDVSDKISDWIVFDVIVKGINDNDIKTPVIVKHKIDGQNATDGEIVSGGGSCMLSVDVELSDGSALSTNNVSYQWYKDDVKIDNATNSSYKVVDAGVYRVKVTLTANSKYVYSDKFNIVLSTSRVKLTVSKIESQTVAKIDDASFSCEITSNSGATTTYQWYKVVTEGASENDQMVSGATNKVFKPSTFGKYFCRVKAEYEGESLSKDSNTFEVKEKNIVITFRQNLNTTSYVGSPLSVEVSTDVPCTYSYQWKRGDLGGDSGSEEDLPDATEPTYIPTNEGIYLCRVKATSKATLIPYSNDSDACTVSGQSVNDVQSPVISTQPCDVSINEGSSLTLKVVASVSDGGVLSYVWKDKSNNTIGTESTYVKSNAQISDSGEYYCVVKNTKNGKTKEVRSNTAIVTVNSTSGSGSVGFDFN